MKICEICGNEKPHKDICKFCDDYHAPEKCTGPGCEICEKIKAERDVEED